VIAATVIGAALLALASLGGDDPDQSLDGGTGGSADTSVPNDSVPRSSGPDNSAPTTAAPEAGTDEQPIDATAPPTTSPATSSTATTSTTVPAVEVDSILIAGDSMARSLFPPVQEALETDATEVRLQWVIGTLIGDEMEKWERIFVDERPDVVVAHFMPWESAALQQSQVIDTSTPGWVTQYRDEWVDRWLDLAESSGSTIVWVTPPLAADTERSDEHQEVGAVWLDAIAQTNDQRADAGTEDVSIIDTLEFSAGPSGEFVAVDATVDPPERLFNTDGVHWCPAGAARLSDRLIDTLSSLGISTASSSTPDWRTSPWAVDPESVRASEPNFGDGFAYPPGECPEP